MQHILLLQNKKLSSEYCAPLTSFDWNETDTKILGTSSIDTTCTIWKLQVKHTPSNKHPHLRVLPRNKSTTHMQMYSHKIVCICNQSYTLVAYN